MLVKKGWLLLIITIGISTYILFFYLVQSRSEKTNTRSKFSPVVARQADQPIFSGINEALKFYAYDDHSNQTDCNDQTLLQKKDGTKTIFHVSFQGRSVATTQILDYSFQYVQPRCFSFSEYRLILYPQDVPAPDTTSYENTSNPPVSILMSTDSGKTWQSPQNIEFLKSRDFLSGFEVSLLSEPANGLDFFVFHSYGRVDLISPDLELLKTIRVFRDVETNSGDAALPIFGLKNKVLFAFEESSYSLDPKLKKGVAVWSSNDLGKNWSISAVPETNSHRFFITIGETFGQIFVDAISDFPDERFLVFQPLGLDGKWKTPIQLQDNVGQILAYDEKNRSLVFTDLSLKKKEICVYTPVVGCWTSPKTSGPVQLLLGEITEEPFQLKIQENWGEYKTGVL